MKLRWLTKENSEKVLQYEQFCMEEDDQGSWIKTLWIDVPEVKEEEEKQNGK